MPILRGRYVLLQSVEVERKQCLTCNAAIKSNIFGERFWSIRMPTEKQKKQLKREARDEAKRKLSTEPDPKKDKPIIAHGEWTRR